MHILYPSDTLKKTFVFFDKLLDHSFHTDSQKKSINKIHWKNTEGKENLKVRPLMIVDAV